MGMLLWRRLPLQPRLPNSALQVYVLSSSDGSHRLL